MALIWLIIQVFCGRNGQVEESHCSQPVLQSPQKWHQKASQTSSPLHQGGIHFSIFLSFDSILKFWIDLMVSFGTDLFIYLDNGWRWTRNSWGTRGTLGSITSRAMKELRRKSRSSIFRFKCFLFSGVLVKNLFYQEYRLFVFVTV